MRAGLMTAALGLFLSSTHAQVSHARHSAVDPERTQFVECDDSGQPKRVFGPISYSQDGQWRAYVQVDVARGDEWLHTTRLWGSRRNETFRLVYLIPPERWNAENGIKILGWAEGSSMLLILTEKWQFASDAGDSQGVMAIDAQSGMLYDCDLGSVFTELKDEQCNVRVTDAGFDPNYRLNILVRAEVATEPDVDETLEDV